MIARELGLTCCVLALAGCAHPVGMLHGELDTGEIAPGAKAELSFVEPGAYEMHCHPHRWMRMVVEVSVDAGANGTVRVDILDGAEEADFRFEPARIRIEPGTMVEFRNLGVNVHTATQLRG